MAPRSASNNERFPSQPAAANSDIVRRPLEREGARTLFSSISERHTYEADHPPF